MKRKVCLISKVIVSLHIPVWAIELFIFNKIFIRESEKYTEISGKVKSGMKLGHGLSAYTAMASAAFIKMIKTMSHSQPASSVPLDMHITYIYIYV